MDDSAALRDTTLRARARLESIASTALERRFGWRRDGVFDAVPGERAAIERYAEARRDSGEPIDVARQRLCGDAAFLALHRGVARRMLAARGLAPDAAAAFGETAGPAGNLEPSPDEADAALADLEPGRLADVTALGAVYGHFAEADRADDTSVAARTRLYTPRWIARFLVENTLGTLWLEMHPDSRLGARLSSLVPRPSAERPPEARLARDVRVLEPACGTMNVGLVAFDLLCAMHEEEIDRAGEVGWPSSPSVPERERIPESIVERNLVGFDVDSRAIDLALLAISIESRSRGGAGRFHRHGLEVAPPPLGTLGRDAAADGPFDVVVTNPPYLDHRDCDETLRRALESRFPEAKRNLYAAFVADGLRRLRDGGRLGIVTPQSYLFVSSFEKLRRAIRASAAIETVAHTGLDTFPEAVVDCALGVFRKESDAAARDAEVATCFRLVHERSTEKKAAALAAAVGRIRAGSGGGARVFRVRASDCDDVPRAPFVYWASGGVRRLFRDLPPLARVASPRQGLATTDNDRFVRAFWEVGHDRVAWNCRSREEAIGSGRRWFPYMKGGSFRRFWGRQELVVDWREDGAAIKRAIALAYPYLRGRWEWVAKNSGYYFKPGITYSYLTSGPFSARLSPPGFVFDVAGSSLFPGGGARRRLALLALLNSKAVAHLLGLVNPTVNFQVGDLARIPVPRRPSARLVRLAAEAVALARESESESETSREFLAPPEGRSTVAARASRLHEIERAIDEEAFALYGIGAADRAGIVADSGPGFAEATASEGEIAWRWVSYAAGIALGRFVPGRQGSPGRGRADHATAAALRALAATSGILDTSELAARAWRALVLLRGEERAGSTVDAALGEAAAPVAALERHFAREFFARHSTLHRNRPPLFLLRAPGRDARSRQSAFSLYLFHERLSPATLETIEPRHVEPRRRALEALPESASARADLEEFATLLRHAVRSRAAHTTRRDDGIPANIASLAGLAAPPPGRSQRARTKTCCVFTRENPSRS